MSVRLLGVLRLMIIRRRLILTWIWRSEIEMKKKTERNGFTFDGSRVGYDKGWHAANENENWPQVDDNCADVGNDVGRKDSSIEKAFD